MKLKMLEPIVYESLKNQPQTRGDDFVLISAVIEKFVDTNISFKSVMEHHQELGIPSFESITRCRRKIQELNPELVNNAVAELREEKVDDFIQYALNMV